MTKKRKNMTFQEAVDAYTRYTNDQLLMEGAKGLRIGILMAMGWAARNANDTKKEG